MLAMMSLEILYIKHMDSRYMGNDLTSNGSK